MISLCKARGTGVFFAVFVACLKACLAAVAALISGGGGVVVAFVVDVWGVSVLDW